jgi:hypothetical protein
MRSGHLSQRTQLHIQQAADQEAFLLNLHLQQAQHLLLEVDQV